VFPDDRVRWHRFDFGDRPPGVSDESGVGPPCGRRRDAPAQFTQPVRDGDDVRLETSPLPDLLALVTPAVRAA